MKKRSFEYTFLLFAAVWIVFYILEGNCFLQDSCGLAIQQIWADTLLMALVTAFANSIVLALNKFFLKSTWVLRMTRAIFLGVTFFLLGFWAYVSITIGQLF